MAMDNGNGKGGQDSPGSKGSSSASAGSSKSGGLGGQNSPAGKNSGGGMSSSSSTSSKSSSTGGGTGGGLNSAGNRASGAGPGASSNRSTTGNNTGGGSGLGGQNSPAGMSNSSLGGSRASSPSSLGGQNSPAGVANSSLSGGMAGGMSDNARRADMAQTARASENASMSTYNAARSLSQDNARRADLAQQARASETTSMRDMSREKALGTISSAEVGAKDPYNTLSGGLIGNVTNMTVRDAVALTKTAWDGKIAPVLGAFQFKGTTLQGIAEKMGLLDAKMTPAVQDRLAVGLMQQRADQATIDGKINVDKFAASLSKEWASLATTTGLSHFADNGIDKASVSYSATRAMAADLVANGVVAPGRAVSSITSADVSAYETKAPGLGHFASTYMGATTPTAAAKPSRSMGQKIAAGAIDVGLGMLPGVGIAASLVNGGLALTGNKTLGENVVDSFVTGTGGAGPDSSTRSGNGGMVASKDTSRDTSTVPAKAEEDTFESRYLSFVDPTPRPTPAERWNYSESGYA